MTATADRLLIRRFAVGGRGFEPLTPSASRKFGDLANLLKRAVTCGNSPHRFASVRGSFRQLAA